MELYGNWSYPTNVRFGTGRIAELGEACVVAGMRRPLLVTDRGLAELPITSKALEVLADHGLEAVLFADVDPNPTEKNLEKGVEAFKAGDHDGVIAFGGGSGLDLGKMVAFMAGQTRPVWDFEEGNNRWQRADASAIAPIVAVPTTAGTGSEVGRASVITNSQTHAKKIIFHPGILAKVVICDPELTIDLPAFLTAGTGLDAFAHCVEAFSSPFYHPFSQGVALEGMRLVKDYLPRAYRDGTDIEARAHLMSAGAMGAIAFQKGLGAIHALSHPIGAMYNTHHGTTNAVCMPAVLELNAPAIRERFGPAAAYLGIDDGFDGFCNFVQEFNDSFDILKGLKNMGVTDDQIPTLVDMVLADPCCEGNPVELTPTNVRILLDKVIR